MKFNRIIRITLTLVVLFILCLSVSNFIARIKEKEGYNNEQIIDYLAEKTALDRIVIKTILKKKMPTEFVGIWKRLDTRITKQVFMKNTLNGALT